MFCPNIPAMISWGSFSKGVLAACLAVAVLTGCSRNQTQPSQTSAPAATNGLQTFQVKGVVTELRPEEKEVVIRHEEIPNYMPAMTMPFEVKNTNELAGLNPGDEVRFKMLVTEDDGWIENIQKTGATTNVAPQRQRTRLVRDVLPLEIGDKMPDYSFTNAFGKRVRFSDFPGQAIAFTFIFTRCPFPTFCPRMNSNFEEAYRLLKNSPSAPTNWHLFSISFDPDFDTPERLKAYSAMYKPDPKHWDWVTGAMIDIDAITEQVGLVFTFENNTINHNLRTVVVDRDGIIRHNFIGNEWSAQELAEAVIEAAQGEPAK
jgi:protein SCO1